MPCRGEYRLSWLICGALASPLLARDAICASEPKGQSMQRTHCYVILEVGPGVNEQGDVTVLVLQGDR